jgi:hypothetical protein
VNTRRARRERASLGREREVWLGQIYRGEREGERASRGEEMTALSTINDAVGSS